MGVILQARIVLVCHARVIYDQPTNVDCDGFGDWYMLDDYW